ncbi:MAG: AMP-binding protein [Candidatus Neomarinimicrobiota bacterium]
MPNDLNQIQDLLHNARGGLASTRELFDLGTKIVNNNLRKSAGRFLELGHLPAVNQAINRSGKIEEWFKLVLKLIQLSNYDFGALFKQRAETYGTEILFRSFEGDNVLDLNYGQAWTRIQSIGKVLLSKQHENLTVGIFTPNSVRGALVDLACLAFHIRVVPISINLSPDHIQYVINHSSITHLFLGDQKSQQTLQEAKLDLKNIQVIHLNNRNDNSLPGIGWNDFMNPDLQLQNNNNRTRSLDSAATILYTSGTTDYPKGIIFTQTNIISKRFARALALPDIGPHDKFLCYLPLYHTFGRFFELLGSIFWGASYTFAESTSLNALFKDFKRANPSIFISIPKRWIQIQEQVYSRISRERSGPEDIKKCLKELTGGSLKWGLSAAGYLDPDTFRFFQENGIQLMSGYGMTEATGGITMTPPGKYLPDSVGIKLPGVELMLAEDKELLMRGPYISPGYLKNDIGGSYSQGWFHSGDIFKIKKDHYFIIDRKKEIYKNTRGQTISPQKIENLFQDFEAVKAVFLVGDGLNYNTVLIYPEPDKSKFDMVNFGTEEKNTYFRSLVFSVNNFLPAYERIINFTLIHRNFSVEKGELTPKNTFRRKIILKHFADVIKPLYAKSFISITHNGFEIRIPNWLLREKKLVRGDISWDGEKLSRYESKSELILNWGSDFVKIGDFFYHANINIINLGKLIQDPKLWLGNSDFVQFMGDSLFRINSFKNYPGLRLAVDRLPFKNEITTAQLSQENRGFKINLKNLHILAQAALSGSASMEKTVLPYFGLVFKKDSNFAILTQHLLLRIQHHPDLNLRLLSLEYLLPHVSGKIFIDLFLEICRQFQVRGSSEFPQINKEKLTPRQGVSMLEILAEYRLKNSFNSEEIIISRALLRLITSFGEFYPDWYARIRAELIWWYQTIHEQSLASYAAKNQQKLTENFRAWISSPQNQDLDLDSGQNYSWKKVIVFHESVPSKYRLSLLKAISETDLIREAVYIFFQGYLLDLKDIKPEGVWITFLGQGSRKNVFRILLQTRNNIAFNVVINLYEYDKDKMEKEKNWFIITGSLLHGSKLVGDFGGEWPDHKIFTEEYNAGETVKHYLDRNKPEIEAGTHLDRWRMRWLHFIWDGTAAYLEFWKRTNRTLFLSLPSISNLIISEFDYAVGKRIISISKRKKETRILAVLLSIYQNYMLEPEKQYSGLRKMADWEILFTSVMEVFGPEEGYTLILDLAEALKNGDNSAFKMGLTPERVQLFIDEIKNHGLLTKQVIFAALRYERWLELNPEATKKARAVLIQDLYKDYGLKNVSDIYPETRLRFFMMTAFKDSSQQLKTRFSELSNNLRQGKNTEEEFSLKLHNIHEEIDLTEDEKYFITRFVFEHVDAADYTELISREIGSGGHLDLAVIVEDDNRDHYRIRPPLFPKEIARFHKLMLEANLQVEFQIEHEFLFIFDKRDHLTGGVFWKKSGPDICHLEKIVIAPAFQKRHLSKRLGEELFNRLRFKNYKHLTVGFFQAGYFYSLGFEIDKKYGGLVKHLERR